MSADFYADLSITILFLLSFYFLAPRFDWPYGGGEEMAIRDYWVYQKRDTPCPWALYIVKEYDRRHPEDTMIDWTLYHEDVPTPTRSKSFVCLHYDTIPDYVDAIAAELARFVDVTEQDLAQLDRALSDILR